MSIWGEADVDEIPDDPFHIEPNTYQALAVECYELEKDGESSLIIKWQIDEVESRFNNMPVTEKYSLPKKPVSEMTGTELQRLSFLKKRLREAFDLTPDEVKRFKPNMATGKRAFIEIVNTPDKKDSTIIYNNVRGAISPRLFMEQGTSDPTDLDI